MKLAINPAVARFAREDLDLSIDEASVQSGIDTKLLQGFEDGSVQPDANAVKKMTKCYKRAFVFFFLPQPPVPTKEIRDFRTLNSATGIRFTYKSNLAISKVHDLKLLAEELSEYFETENDITFDKVTLADDPEAAANACRDLSFKIKRSKPKTDADAFDAFRNWIEDMGIFVVQVPMLINDARGFAISDAHYPVIAINQKDNYKSKNFTLLHELAHLMLGKTAIFYSSEELGYKADRSMEKFCNRLAGAFLVPAKELLSHPLVRGVPHGYEWPDSRLKVLATHFFVSKETVLRRFVDLGFATNEFYREKRDLWEEERRKFIPPKIMGMKRDFARECYRNYGKKLLSLTLQGFDQNRIAPSDLYQYLSLRQKHLTHLREILSKD